MSKQPLLVHVVFHPESKTARSLARHIHRQLNDDSFVSGLRVPTVFCPVEEGNQPPAALSLDAATHSFVVVLADDEMCVDDVWSKFAADLWHACDSSRHRCVPMQLTEHAWPLDQRLKQVNFGRAFGQPEGEARNAWVTRRVIIELCRFLRGMDASNDQSRAPIELFLSHAKTDMAAGECVAQTVINELKTDQPVDVWVDSGEIETGSKFSDAITSGVARTSLLVILTDNYSTREWCREEVMLAKEHQRPIAVIDALMKFEVRSFPFLENVPKVRWNGSSQDGVDLLLKESLRHLQNMSLLKSISQSDDLIFMRPPEPVTLLGLEPGTNVFYPDPPLGLGEIRRLSKTGVKFSTPLQRSAVDRSLDGQLVALSMSESTDISRWGLDPLHLNQAILDVTRHLLIRGASLAYGGHLGSEGYTQMLFEMVRGYNSQERVEPFERIVNHRGWPLPKLPVSDRAKLKSVSTIMSIPRPDDIDESLHSDFVVEPQGFFPGDKSPEHRLAWCRGMTEMRAFQSDQSRSNVIARIILGGSFGPTVKVTEGQPPKEKWYSSRMPGVLEEILLSLKAGQPVFLIGAFGGVAKLAIDLLQGRHRPAADWEYQSKAPFAAETRELYARRGCNWWYYGDEPRVNGLDEDDSLPIRDFLAAAWNSPSESGWETRLNPLSRAENLELFETVDSARIVEILMRGLSAITV